MNKTNIEWVKNPDGSQGYTANPIKGKCPMGCPYCYTLPFYYRFGWDPTLRWEQRVLDELGKSLEISKKPLGIFLCSTNEWQWNDEWAEAIYGFCEQYQNHRIYLLTKLPQELPKFSPFPENCWVGVTITNRVQAHNASHYLPIVEAGVKFISYEPLLDDVTQALYNFNNIHFNCNWVIIGQQTPPSRKTAPEIEWVRKIVEVADQADIPVFLKDNLEPLFKQNDIWAIPEWAGFQDWTKQEIYTTLRQELPKMTLVRNKW